MAETKKVDDKQTVPVDPEAERLDETIPGGKYNVGDEVVDAHGEPFKGRAKDKVQSGEGAEPKG